LVRFGVVEVHIVGRLTRRRVVGTGILAVATLVTVLASTAVNATPSRAANRWNHTPGVSTTGLSALDAGTEPQVKGPIWQTLVLFDQFSKRYTFVDVGKKGDSPGDYGVFKDPILTKGGVRIGTIDAQCISAYSNQCSGSIRIPGRGQITFGGISPFDAQKDFYAITGGTGEFASVGGMLTIEFPFIDAAKLTIVLTH
jgi:hypothetical protein